MKKKYCFIPHSGYLSPDEKIFCVWVGSCDRDHVKKVLVENFADDTGAFFRLWDEDTDFYLSQVTTCRVRNCEKFRFSYERIDVSISDFYKALIGGNIANLKNNPGFHRNVFRLSSMLSPAFFMRKNLFFKNSIATSEIRKNLSLKAQSDSINAAIGFCLILVMFLLGALLDGVEKVMLLY